METLAKHYNYINSKTGNIIYHYTVNQNLDPNQLKEELNLILAQVAVTNGLLLGTVYWEEVKNEEI